jgi:hypothetical protein
LTKLNDQHSPAPKARYIRLREALDRHWQLADEQVPSSTVHINRHDYLTSYLLEARFSMAGLLLCLGGRIGEATYAARRLDDTGLVGRHQRV